MRSRNHVSDLGSCRLPYGDIKRPMIYRVKGVGKQQEPQRPFPPVRPRPAKGYETGRKEGLECRISCRIIPFVSLVTRGTIASRSRNGRERKNNNKNPAVPVYYRAIQYGTVRYRYKENPETGTGSRNLSVCVDLL